MPTDHGPMDVWLYGTHLAGIELVGQRIRWTWLPAATDRWGRGARVVSELLPTGPPPERPHDRRVEVFLEGLLPEGNAREHLAHDASLVADDVYGMIAAYGRDTAGALVFLPAGHAQPSPDEALVPVDVDEIGAMLRRALAHAPALGSEPGVQSTSLAGMQPKIVLVRTADGWARPLGGAPSTHIVKLAHPVDSAAADVVDTEAAALAMAREVGLGQVEATVEEFAGVRAIVVSRYDRRTVDGRTERVHQEDSAQALGIHTADPNRKFQRGKRLPNLAAIADVLRNGGSEPDALLSLTTFNLAIGNTDAHAKNISVLRLPDGSARLAPAYDVAMHLHHRGATRSFAMDVNATWDVDRLTAADLVAEGESWGLPRRRAQRVVRTALERCEVALAVLERPEHAAVSAAARRAVTRQVTTLLSGLPEVP